MPKVRTYKFFAARPVLTSGKVFLSVNSERGIVYNSLTFYSANTIGTWERLPVAAFTTYQASLLWLYDVKGELICENAPLATFLYQYQGQVGALVRGVSESRLFRPLEFNHAIDLQNSYIIDNGTARPNNNVFLFQAIIERNV